MTDYQILNYLPELKKHYIFFSCKKYNMNQINSFFTENPIQYALLSKNEYEFLNKFIKIKSNYDLKYIFSDENYYFLRIDTVK